MNNFATLERYLPSLKGKVSYYTIRITSNDQTQQLTETDKFYKSIVEKDCQNEALLMHTLVKTLAYIGVREEHARDERLAQAFWPKGHAMKKLFSDYPLGDLNHVRLYLFRVNDNIVILYGGDLKSIPGPAQNCPVVGKHFRLAQKISKFLMEELRLKSITPENFEADSKDLIIPI